jgi:membrane-associated phospholipid phosphatase
MILGTTIAAIITLLINLRWKISAHMVGIGGVLGAVIGISERFMQNLNGTIIVLFLVAGMIGYARLKLDAHTSLQVYAGFATGFGCLLLMIIAF